MTSRMRTAARNADEKMSSHCAARITRRLENRSAATPPSGVKSSIGMPNQNITMPSDSFDWVRS